MTRRSPLPTVVLSGLILLFVAVGFWFRWGSGLRSRYVATLDALRESGQPVEWDDVDREAPEPHEDAYPMLKAAGALAECIYDDLSWIDPDDPDRPSLPSPHGREYWTDGEAALVDEAIGRFEPGYLMIDEALRKPDLCLPLGNEMGDGIEGVPEIGGLVRFLEYEAYRHPKRAPRAAERILDLVRLWRPRLPLELCVRSALTERALGILRHGLEEGALDPGPLRVRWRGLLADADALAGAAAAVASERVGWIWLHERWLEGKDPFVEGRAALDELRTVLESAASLTGQPPLTVPLPPYPPWHSRWYGRPVFYRRALERLADLERGIEAAGSEAGMRASVLAAAHSDRRAGSSVRIHLEALRHLTIRRLARVALAIHEHARGHDTPLATLDDYAPILGEPLPIDAVTGRQFGFECSGERVTVTAPLLPRRATAVGEMSPEDRREYLRDEFVSWEIRYGR